MTLHPGWRKINGTKLPVFYEFIPDGIRLYYYHKGKREVIMSLHKFNQKNIPNQPTREHIDLLHKLFKVYILRVDYDIYLPKYYIPYADVHIGVDGKDVKVRLPQLFRRDILNEN